MSALRPLTMLVLFAAAACSSAANEPAGGAAAFPADPLMTLTSDGGTLHLAIRTAPSQPPTRGTVSVEYAVTDASGAPATGLHVDIEPWMPAMGHGASTKPAVADEGGGKYVASGLDLFMPGRWELRTTFTGAASDHATVVLDIP
jgi:hypothetical protein